MLYNFQRTRLHILLDSNIDTKLNFLYIFLELDAVPGYAELLAQLMSGGAHRRAFALLLKRIIEKIAT